MTGASPQIVVVPAAPLLLPAFAGRQPSASRQDVTALCSAIDEVLAPTHPARVIVVVVSGADTLVRVAPNASLGPLGHPHRRVDLPPVPAEVRESLEDLAPVSDDSLLIGDAAVLAMHVAAVTPALPVVALEVGHALDRAATERLAAACAALDARVGPIALVVAGDLAATLDTVSPGYLVEDAGVWDRTLLDALMDGDRDTLEACGPARATEVMARGWTPLRLAAAVADAAGRRLAVRDYRAPRGVGQLVAVAP